MVYQVKFKHNSCQETTITKLIIDEMSINNNHGHYFEILKINSIHEIRIKKLSSTIH